MWDAITRLLNTVGILTFSCRGRGPRTRPLLPAAVMTACHHRRRHTTEAWVVTVIVNTARTHLQNIFHGLRPYVSLSCVLSSLLLFFFFSYFFSYIFILPSYPHFFLPHIPTLPFLPAYATPFLVLCVEASSMREDTTMASHPLFTRHLLNTLQCHPYPSVWRNS